MDLAIRDIEDYRDDDVPLSGVSQHPFETLPVLYSEAGIVEPRVKKSSAFTAGHGLRNRLQSAVFIAGSPYMVLVRPLSSTRTRLILSRCNLSKVLPITCSSRQPINQKAVVPLKK
jgi:hypothetical protein